MLGVLRTIQAPYWAVVSATARLVLICVVALPAFAQTPQMVLPRGSSFGDLEETVPFRRFQSEFQTGQRSQQSRLGELLFEAPRLLGGLARDIGMSCDTCHIRGGANPDFFIPRASTRPGTFDRAPELFNPSAHAAALKAIRIPNLIGIGEQKRFGHDGRAATLQDFVHDVITEEFAGPSPSPEILGLLVAYLTDLKKQPNKRLSPDMKIMDPTQQEKRGEEIFKTPFDGHATGCASCHIPSQDFTDQLLHQIAGSTNRLRTPSLLDRVKDMPYFHDGRAATREAVIVEKNKIFDIGFNTSDQEALAAYLAVIETGDQSTTPSTADGALADIQSAQDGLRFALTLQDSELIAIAADGFARKLKTLADRYDTRIEEAEFDRLRVFALSAIADAAIATFQLRSRAEERQLDGIAIAFHRVVEQVNIMREPVIKAEPYSLFNAERLRAYRAKLEVSLPKR